MRVFPGSANWYVVQNSDSNRNNKYGFASRNEICLYSLKGTNLTFEGFLIGHDERIMGFLFNPLSPDLCASYTQDGNIKVWDSESLNSLQSFNLKLSIVCSAWSCLSYRILIVACKNGSLYLLNWQDSSKKIEIKTNFKVTFIHTFQCDNENEYLAIG